MVNYAPPPLAASDFWSISLFFAWNDEVYCVLLLKYRTSIPGYLVVSLHNEKRC
jgi:hypothetical protein